MKILKEAKESLPVSFITSFVSDGWEKVGILKEEIEAIKNEFKGTDKVEELIQALIDAYLVCIGQMEQYLADKNGIELGQEEVKESLKEDVTINIDHVEINEPEVEVKSKEIEACDSCEDPLPATSVPVDEITVEVPAEPIEEEPVVEVSEEQKSDIDRLADIEEACKKEELTEKCDFLFDEFPEPVVEVTEVEDK